MVAANGSGPTIDLPRRNERLDELIAHGLSAYARYGNVVRFSSCFSISARFLRIGRIFFCDASAS